MSKRILLILSLSLLITIIHCAGDCTDKFPYNLTKPQTGEDPFTDGDTRKVWNHEHSCNSLGVETNNEVGKDPKEFEVCCYIHIEYESLITGERHDKYGCVNVTNPYKDYDGDIERVKERASKIEEDLKNLTVQGSNDRVVSDDHLHVKIVCGANFTKISLFALLVLILF